MRGVLSMSRIKRNHYLHVPRSSRILQVYSWTTQYEYIAYAIHQFNWPVMHCSTVAYTYSRSC